MRVRGKPHTSGKMVNRSNLTVLKGTGDCTLTQGPQCRAHSPHVSISVWRYVHVSACLYVSMSTCQQASLSACLDICISACRHVSSSAWPHVSTLSVRQPVSLSVGQRVWTFTYRHVRMSASAYPQGVSISASVCQHTSLSACQNVSKSECLQDCMSPCQRLSASASQCQRTSMPTCQHVNMRKACQVVSVLSVWTCLWATVSACQHVSVFNYNVTSEKNFPKNLEDYVCIVKTVLNVLYPLWSCILF